MANTIIKKITAGAMAMVVALALVGCSTQKLVPQDHYLLDKVKLTSDSKELAASKYNEISSQREERTGISRILFPFPHTLITLREKSTEETFSPISSERLSPV